MIKPQTFASHKDYRDALFALLVKFEGDKKYLHIGPKGVPAIGPGVELIVKGDSGYASRKRVKIDELLIAAHGRPTKLSDADWLWMGKVADLMRNGGLRPEQLKVEISKLMKGHGIKPFTGTGLRRLSDVAVEEAEKRVGKSIKQAAKKAGIDPDAAVAAFANSREIPGLVSQGYNNLDSPKAIAALLRGNRAEAFAEMGYRSNKGKTAGVAARRMEEAAGVAGDPKSWTPEQKRQWRDLYNRDEAKFNEYDAKFESRIPVGGRFAD